MWARGVALCALVALCLACGGLDEAGVGGRVNATRPGAEAPQAATVVERYGKLVQLRFDDGQTAWLEVDAMDPPGVAAPDPGGSCARELADTVRFTVAGRAAQGLVGDTYGDKANVLRDEDAEFVWLPCDALELVPDAPEPEPEPVAPAPGGGGGGGGVSAEVTKCQRGCNSRCNGAQNKSKCVGECRRACAR